MYANSGRGGRGGGRGRGAAGSGGGFSGKGRGFPPAKGNGNFSGGGKGKGKGGKGGKGKDRGVFIPQLPLKERNAEVDRKDAIFGYEKLDKTVTAGTEYVGWMTNFRTVTVEEEDGSELSAVEYYFIGPDGSGFKALQTAQPYMYISVAPGTENEVEAALRRTFPVEVRSASAVARTAAAAGRMGSQEPGGGVGWGWGALRTRRHCCAERTTAHHSAHRCLPPRGCLACAQLKDVQPKMQEDLTLPNHLSGLRKKYLQLRFDSCRDLMTVRKTILRRSMPTRGQSAAAPQGLGWLLTRRLWGELKGKWPDEKGFWDDW